MNLNAFAQLPRPVSKALTGAFFTLKLAILALFVLGVVLFPYRGPPPVRVRWELSVLLIGMIIVLLRTLVLPASSCMSNTVSPWWPGPLSRQWLCSAWCRFGHLRAPQG